MFVISLADPEIYCNISLDRKQDGHEALVQGQAVVGSYVEVAAKVAGEAPQWMNTPDLWVLEGHDILQFATPDRVWTVGCTLFNVRDWPETPKGTTDLYSRLCSSLKAELIGHVVAMRRATKKTILALATRSARLSCGFQAYCQHPR